MNGPAHDTALFLVTSGDVTAFGTDVFVGREPLSPVECVTCYDTGGGPGPLVDLRKPTVQVRVRSASYATGWAKANGIHETLTAPIATTSTDVDALWWSAISDVAFIGRDDHDRAIFTANYELTRDGAE